ncbi:MAG: regulatory protein RecX [Chitinophagaceae bacterium]
MSNSTKVWNRDSALEKIRSFCAYQERCHQEVRKKLLEWGLSQEMAEEIVALLITENFLNEERFARSFARGKFRFNQWGRNRIRYVLTQKQVSSYCIKKGLEEVELATYRQVIKKLWKKKYQSLSNLSPGVRKARVSTYLVQKGYEPELVREISASMISGHLL